MKCNIMAIGYGMLSAAATVALGFSFFDEVSAATQIILLCQSAGFAFVSGVCVFEK